MGYQDKPGQEKTRGSLLAGVTLAAAIMGFQPAVFACASGDGCYSGQGKDGEPNGAYFRSRGVEPRSTAPADAGFGPSVGKKQPDQPAAPPSDAADKKAADKPAHAPAAEQDAGDTRSK